MPVRVRVPASSANLGPGYDAFGLALDLHNEFAGELADEWHVDVVGEGAGHLSSGADNRIARAMAVAFAEAGRPELRARIENDNGIPVGRGLGSSSAAIVGGLMLGSALAGVANDPARIFELAAGIEGHADNAAAAVYGGFTVSTRDAGGARCVRIDPARGLAVVVVAGEAELDTTKSRAALPDTVSHADAAAGAGRAALVALGLALGNEDALSLGLHDTLHESYRHELIPDLGLIRGILVDAGAPGAVLSGAGPSVLAVIPGPDDERALTRALEIAENARPRLHASGRGRVMAVGIDRVGASFV